MSTMDQRSHFHVDRILNGQNERLSDPTTFYGGPMRRYFSGTPAANLEKDMSSHETLTQVTPVTEIVLGLAKQNGFLHETIRELEAQLRRSEEYAHEIERRRGPPVVQIQRQLGVLHYMRCLDPDSVRVTPPTFLDDSGCLHPSTVFPIDAGSFTWQSNNTPESWISFELVGKKLRLSSYSLRSSLNGGNYLQIWLVKGSRDGQHWEDIDLRRDANIFVDNTDIHSFDLHPMTVPYSHFRFIQHGKNNKATDHFCLSFVELFGELHDA
jgi:hypothetical protein